MKIQRSLRNPYVAIGILAEASIQRLQITLKADPGCIRQAGQKGITTPLQLALLVRFSLRRLTPHRLVLFPLQAAPQAAASVELEEAADNRLFEN